ncbi:nitrite reductase (NAD(P)H) small subunit [Escherichia coli]
MSQWKDICKMDDILPEPVCALLGDEQVAIFRPYHSGPRCLRSATSRSVFRVQRAVTRADCGTQGELWVASPLKKQRFRLSDGLCMEDGQFSSNVAKHE